MAKKLTFQEMLDAEFAKAQAAVDERRELDERVSALKKAEDAHLVRMSHLNRLAYLNERLTVGHWSDSDVDGRHNGILKGVNLQTAIYNFDIYIQERADLKAYKYEVQVRGQRVALDSKPHEVHGGYKYWDYIKTKYTNLPKGEGLIEKFRTMDEAVKYVENWQTKISADHIDEIVEDQKLVKIIRDSGFVFDRDKKYYTRYYK